MDKIFAPIKGRILEYIEYKDITKESFYKESGVTASNFKGKGIKSELGGDKIAKILSLYNDLNAEWLVTGNGKMLKESRPVQAAEPAPKLQLLQNSMAEYESRNLNIISIPMVDVWAAAGSGAFNPDHPETLGELNLPATMLKKRNGNYYCGRVNGESMTPTLLYYDYIVFRLLQFGDQSEIRDGKIYFIVDYNGASYVKRIRIEENELICISDNINKKEYADFRLSFNEIAHIYEVEWRFSKNLDNLNNGLYERVNILESQYNEIQQRLSNTSK